MFNHYDYSGRSVLIVDDEPANLRTVAHYLGERGLEVLTATDGGEAMERALGDRPDLILLDVVLPEEDGYRVCHRLKEEAATRHIPVLFLSVLGAVEDKLKGFAAGGVDYVTKPIDEAELLARVTTHLYLGDLQRELEEKNARLDEALDASYVVNVAVGVLMERHRIDRERAFQRLRGRARSERRKVQAVAEELLAALELIDACAD